MNIIDLRRIQPIYPSQQQFLDLRKNIQDNTNYNKKQPSNDFNSILQDEINKLK